MSRFGEELLQSAREAVAIAKGELRPAGKFEVDEIDVAAIRHRLRLTQKQFAERYGLAVATVRDWEQKRRHPDRIAANLLRVIDHAPETVQRALAAS